MYLKNKMNKLALLLAMGGLLVVSCTKDDNLGNGLNNETDITQSQQSAEIDLISEDIDAIVEEVYTADELLESGFTNARSQSNFYLPDCVTITTIVTDTSKEKTIDFGSGCQLPNGHVVSGIIFMSYAKDLSALTNTIEVGFDNFHINNISIEGSRSVFRQRSNENGNPQASRSVNITVTWPDETYASRVGSGEREWIEGYGSGNWGDNVFLITGTRTTTFRNGNVRSGTIISPVRRELSCNFLVSGTIDIQRNNWEGNLDFGDGTCDNTAILTLPDGSTYTINL